MPASCLSPARCPGRTLQGFEYSPSGEPDLIYLRDLPPKLACLLLALAIKVLGGDTKAIVKKLKDTGMALVTEFNILNLPVVRWCWLGGGGAGAAAVLLGGRAEANPAAVLPTPVAAGGVQAAHQGLPARGKAGCVSLDRPAAASARRRCCIRPLLHPPAAAWPARSPAGSRIATLDMQVPGKNKSAGDAQPFGSVSAAACHLLCAASKRCSADWVAACCCRGLRACSCPAAAAAACASLPTRSRTR